MEKLIAKVTSSFISRIKAGEVLSIEKFLDHYPPKIRKKTRPLLETAILMNEWSKKFQPEEFDELLQPQSIKELIDLIEEELQMNETEHKTVEKPSYEKDYIKSVAVHFFNSPLNDKNEKERERWARNLLKKNKKVIKR